MSMRVSVSAATSCSLLWKKTRVPSAEAPRNWLLIAPLPPFGPVDTSSVVLWFPHAAAHERSQQSAVPASAPVFAVFNFPPSRDGLPGTPLLNHQSRNPQHRMGLSC